MWKQTHRLVLVPVLVGMMQGCAVSSQPPGATLLGTLDVPFVDSVEQLGYVELAATYSEEQLDALLGEQLASQSETIRRAAVTLLSLGAFNADDLAQPERVKLKLADFVAVQSNPHRTLLGRLGDSALHTQLSQVLNWEGLLAERELLNRLGQALSDGLLTGYDLRETAVYDTLPDTHTLIYSHSDLHHLRQLVALLDGAELRAWVYLTPKVSAFLYREGWGGDGAHLVTLDSGVRVVQGREMAVAFRFETTQDRQRFHELVEQYAKRDSEEERGLISGSWWQPFYYTGAPIKGFESISLLVVAGGSVEATLTVLEERTESVMGALAALLADGGHEAWTIRREQVWVNPAFFRFLQGDFK